MATFVLTKKGSIHPCFYSNERQFCCPNEIVVHSPAGIDHFTFDEMDVWELSGDPPEAFTLGTMHLFSMVDGLLIAPIISED